MDANTSLAELVGTLEDVSGTLRAMRATLDAQRDAVTSNDLSHLLTIIGQQEELGARLARLERRRQRIQRTIEDDLQVEGVRQIANQLSRPELARERLIALADDVADQVLQLQQENRRNARLLRSSIDLAQRSRTYLLKLGGAEPAYLPPIPPLREPLRQTAGPVPRP